MLRKISITARTMIVAAIMALSLSGVAQAQFEDMLLVSGASADQGTAANATRTVATATKTPGNTGTDLFTSSPVDLMIVGDTGGAHAASGWGGAINPGASGVGYTSDYARVKASISTPMQAAAYMRENFSYQQDFRIDGFTPVSPATLNESKWGDCKDFTTFMGDVLKDDGIVVKPISIKYGSSSSSYHIMSVVEFGGKAYLQSNQDIWQVGSNDEIVSIATNNLPNPVVGSSLLYYGSYSSYEETKKQYKR